ncbi:MAG: hypothetical protein EHM18_13455 [Acidobacteria bacterium]|nr:MAG: hypothetical protein EHM18_13455 [Acidobacteriota bacterium]
MAHLAVVLTVLLLFGSAGTGAQADPQIAGGIDLTKAASYLAEFEELCKADGGKLWGVSFCGPFLLVDPSTRAVVANRADSGGLLEPRSSLYVGQLPENVMIANTAVEWSGLRWTMLMWWSLSENRTDRLALMAHEAFHRVQPELKLEPSGSMNSHLDTADGRFWLQLEWNALGKALLLDGEAKRAAVADALAFRAARRGKFPNVAERENALEIFEGLAEYSGMRLVGFSPQQVVQAVDKKRAGERGFVRSFAYNSGPLYGFLLDRASDGWRRRVRADSDLAGLLAHALGLVQGTAGRAELRAEAHGGAALRASENQREKKRQAQITAWRAALIDGPVLVLDLKSVTSGTFDPRAVFPMAEQQIVYTRRELMAEWGTLRVDAGAILEDQAAGRGYVSLAGVSPDHLKGEGWTLKVNPGWKLLPGPRSGDFMIVKE